jgi:hypothetical protein
VEQVRPAAARDYLTRRGWNLLPAEQTNLEPYASPGSDEEVVSVPLAVQGRDYVQRVIELVTAVALTEKRYAVDVLNDILRPPAETDSNGISAASASEKAAR